MAPQTLLPREASAPPLAPGAVVAVNPKGGRFVAWCGFVFGSLLSIGGNILYTWTPHKPEGAPLDWTPPADWAPSPWAQIGAAAWSVMLLLAVEVLSRVAWPDRLAWKLARFGGVGVVALGSAVISYGHLHHVLTEWNYGTLGSAVGPLVIDGLMTVCGFALLADSDHQTTPDRPAETAVQTTETAGSDRPVRLVAEMVRTTETTRSETTERRELAAGPDHPQTTTSDHPGPAPDLRAVTQTAGPDHLFDEAVRWAAELDGPPSQRAVRTRFGIGRDRAVAVLEHIEQAGAVR